MANSPFDTYPGMAQSSSSSNGKGKGGGGGNGGGGGGPPVVPEPAATGLVIAGLSLTLFGIVAWRRSRMARCANPLCHNPRHFHR